MKITSAENPEVDNLLVTEDDVKVAVFMSKVLTKALSNLTHRHLKAKLSDQFSNLISKQLNSADLQSQISKIAAAETALTNKVAFIYYIITCIAQNLKYFGCTKNGVFLLAVSCKKGHHFCCIPKQIFRSSYFVTALAKFTQKLVFFVKAK
jgi:hypothetical protein